MVYCLNLNYCHSLYSSLCCCLSLAKLLSEAVFAHQCSLPVPWMPSYLMLQLALFPSLSVHIVLQFIFNMFNNSMSGMPKNLFPFPQTTEKMVFLCLSLFSFSTLHLPNCVIVIQLYVFSFVASFVVTS